MPLNEKDRLANLGDLAAILAHEMKNPMNSIIINLELLRSTLTELTSGVETPSSQRAKKYLDVVEGEVKRLDKVLRGFLDFASPPQTTRIRFKVNPVIKLMVDFMAPEFKNKGATLQCELESELPAVHGSADQFKQALLNLMLNALQAMPEQNGHTTVKTKTEGTHIVIEVSDNGTGIDPQIFSKIFDPYFTTKTKGSGLGLTVVKRFAKDHGGDVRVESKAGQGTVFAILLPQWTSDPS